MASQDAEETGDWVTVLTTIPTLPLPANTERPLVETERLVLRALTEDDLPVFHELRSRPRVMRFTKRGAADEDIDYTRGRLTPFLPPNDIKTFNYAICLRAAGENKLIGVGGVHLFRSSIGWPEVGYMLHDDHWGKGYATEFLHAFVKAYSALPRPDKPVPLRVTRDSLPADVGASIVGDGDDASTAPVVDEMLMATVADRNGASQKVIAKGGFEKYKSRTEPEWSNPALDVLLHYYRYLPGRAAFGSEQ
ncbi:acyl- n-acyltransferase [Ophiostoma piceae UAMH 11346]|uniref:Acyl-n-acyltransferase n=1 Tax=Ophiostoma piceae (strain UAMH 11346) TaxID=1262450 RepID=S3CC04_OPHP1|nr:acyl- n-acyltransferase [Ophiostoma piceae UAMH 11346]